MCSSPNSAQQPSRAAVQGSHLSRYRDRLRNQEICSSSQPREVNACAELTLPSAGRSTARAGTGWNVGLHDPQPQYPFRSTEKRRTAIRRPAGRPSLEASDVRSVRLAPSLLIGKMSQDPAATHETRSVHHPENRQAPYRQVAGQCCGTPRKQPPHQTAVAAHTALVDHSSSLNREGDSPRSASRHLARLHDTAGSAV